MKKGDGKSENAERTIKTPIPLPNTSQYLWGLNEYELKIVYAILEKNHKTTWEQVAKKLGISRRQLYNWRQSPKIQEPIRKYSRDLLLSELPDVYKALVKKAKSGDCGAMKLYFEIVENIDVQKQKALEFRRGVNPLQEMIDLIHQSDSAKNNNKSANNNVAKSDENATGTDS
jgi:transposase-like protein